MFGNRLRKLREGKSLTQEEFLKLDIEKIYNILTNEEKRRFLRSFIDYIKVKSKDDIELKFL